MVGSTQTPDSTTTIVFNDRSKYMSNSNKNDETTYIFSGYASDYNMGLKTSYYTSTDSLLQLILHFFQKFCKASRGEIATLLEEGNYNITVTKLVDGKPLYVLHKDFGFPWLIRQQLDEQITQLETGLATFRSLASLNDIPGAPSLFNTDQMDVPATEKFIQELRDRRDSVIRAWEDVKNDVNARPLRQVQVDPPENSNDIPF